MNQPTATGRAIRRLLLFCFCTGIMLASFAQRQKMELLFDANGKLLSGYTPRFNPKNAKKDCHDTANLQIKVLLPLNFYKKDLDKMDKKAEAIRKLTNDENKTLLAGLLKGCKGEDYLTPLKEKFSGTFDQCADTVLVPGDLIKYVRFLRAFQGAGKAVSQPASAAGKEEPNQASQQKTTEKNKSKENTPQKLFAGFENFRPFDLTVNGIKLSNDCIDWTVEKRVEVDCKCIPADQSFIALVFKVPSRILTEKTAPDSFQLIRRYPDKEIAIDWYNTSLTEVFKEDLYGIRLIDGRIRESFDSLALAVDNLDSLMALLTPCPDEAFFEARRAALRGKVSYLDSALQTKFGSSKCGDRCKSFLHCSEQLRKWIARMLWLSGDQLLLNPFRFTDATAFDKRKSVIQQLIDSLQREKRIATAKAKFWDAAISHLQDSILRRDLDISLGSRRLDSLVTLKRYNDSIAGLELPELPAADIAKNLEEQKAFLTTSRVFYKGWIVPYWQSATTNAYKQDKRWVRSYYLDQMPEPLQQQLHFFYPENENMTVLLHNVPAGTGSLLEQDLKPFADSAEFTKAAGRFVEEIAGLYSSLAQIAPSLGSVLKFLNARPDKTKPKSDSQPEMADVTPVAISTFSGTFAPSLNTTDSGRLKLAINNRSQISWIFRFKKVDSVTQVMRITASNQGDKPEVMRQFNSLRVSFPGLINADVVPLENAADTQVMEITQASQIDDSLLKVLCNNTKVKYIVVGRVGDPYVKLYPLDSRNLAEYARLAAVIRNDVFPPVSLASELNDWKCARDYYKALLSIAAAPAMIAKELEAITDTTPARKTDRFPLADSAAPYTNNYVLRTYTKDGDKIVNGATVASSYINVGKFRYWQTAAGIAYSPNAGFINSVDTSGGGLVITRDEDRFRLIGGFRLYPFGLYNQRNPVGLFREMRWIHRLSILGAIGVPKPFQNLYLGAGFDIVPGLNLTVGAHFQQQNNYEIVANQVKSRTVSYKPLTFYSVTIDPGLLVNVVKSLFK